MRTRVIIPFRDRGNDPRRGANLEVVAAWWYAHGYDVTIQSDGLCGDAQFNRHAAYNMAAERFPETQVFVFAEADMLIHPTQVDLAVRLAKRKPGLVVPFTQYRYLSESATWVIRDYYHDQPTEGTAQWWGLRPEDEASIFRMPAEGTLDDGDAVGAINVVSRETLDITGGFTEATSGNWYDDNIIEEAFRFLTGNRTAFVPGPAVHMYHLSGHKGDHLTEADRRATQRNKNLLTVMRQDIARGNRLAVRTLLCQRDLTVPRVVC